MKLQRRWIKSVIATSGQPLPALPWQRSKRKAAPPAPQPRRAAVAVAAR